jgi:hypothetical protein
MKEIAGHPGYFVTEDGRVFSSKSGEIKERKQYKTKKGYNLICINTAGKQYTYRVHRLVAELYIPNPDNLPQVNHKDENKTNNHASNLEWCDNQYNCEYSHSVSHKIKTPTGEIVEVYNIRKFCRENNLHSGALYCRGKNKGYSIVT